MQKQRTRTDAVSSAEADRGSQAGVLAHLLHLRPAHLTVEEIVREFTNDPEDFEQRDQVERAVDDLVQAALMHRNGKFVVPALPAVHFDVLALRGILSRAVRDGVLATNPAINTDRDEPLELPYERPTMHFLIRNDARRYLDSCSDWYRPLAEVLIGAGLRIGEAIALEWRDVDWDGAALNIVRAAKDSGIGTPKGDRSRRVVIDPFLLGLLRQHRSAAARDGELAKLVFRSPTGRMLDRHNVRRRGHDAALRRAGLPSEVRLHDLRHTAATLWLASGESIYFVQQQLGHKDIQTTIDLYGHPDQAAHREAAARARSVVARGRLGVVLGTAAGTATRLGHVAQSSQPASEATSPAADSALDRSAETRARQRGSQLRSPTSVVRSE